MSSLRLGSNFAVFALFFGLSLLEAFQAGNWLRAAFWLALRRYSFIPTGKGVRNNSEIAFHK